MPWSWEAPAVYPTLSAPLCGPTLQGCGPGFLPQDKGGKSSALGPQHLLFHTQKLSLHTTAAATRMLGVLHAGSEVLSPRPLGLQDFTAGSEALSPKPLGLQDFTARSEALSPRPLGLQAWHTEESALVLASSFRQLRCRKESSCCRTWASATNGHQAGNRGIRVVEF